MATKLTIMMIHHLKRKHEQVNNQFVIRRVHILAESKEQKVNLQSKPGGPMGLQAMRHALCRLKAAPNKQFGPTPLSTHHGRSIFKVIID